MRLLLWPPLIFGGVCALAALLKRRSAFNWFLLGMIFQVFALAILLFLPALSLKSEERPKSSGQVTCPYCHGLIKLDAQRCPHCGQDVRPIDI